MSLWPFLGLSGGPTINQESLLPPAEISSVFFLLLWESLTTLHLNIELWNRRKRSKESKPLTMSSLYHCPKTHLSLFPKPAFPHSVDLFSKNPCTSFDLVKNPNTRILSSTLNLTQKFQSKLSNIIPVMASSAKPEQARSPAAIPCLTPPTTKASSFTKLQLCFFVRSKTVYFDCVYGLWSLLLLNIICTCLQQG